MEFPGAVQAALAKAGATAGDTVEVTARRELYLGVVMPHHSFSGDDILTLKLENGYNVGIEVRDISAVHLVRKHDSAKPGPRRALPGRGKPTMAILGTGGTIASYVDYRTGAVHPAVTAEELVFSVPELLDLVDVRARVVYSTFSENLRPGHWQNLAGEIGEEFAAGARAVVVPHGTDTLHFTTAALSFMLSDLPGPVIVVGAQRSSDRPSSDAAMNLVCSAHLAAADLGEVVALMHAETGDTFCSVHRGTKVRKMHTSRRDAFRSINAPPLGAVHFDGRVELGPDARRRSPGPPRIDVALDPRVALVTFYPGLAPDRLEGMLRDMQGVVLQGTGLGHVASDLIQPIAKFVRDGNVAVMTSQTLYGRVNLRVYDTGRDLLKAGVIGGEDMLPEVAYVKLMWLLKHAKDLDEVARRMGENLAGEISPKIGLDAFEA